MLAIVKYMSSKSGLQKQLYKLDELKKFKRGIGITEKTHKTRRDPVM